MSSKATTNGFGHSAGDIQLDVPRVKVVNQAEMFNNGFDDLVATNSAGEWLDDGMEDKPNNTNGHENLPESHSRLDRKFSPDKIKGNRFLSKHFNSHKQIY